MHGWYKPKYVVTVSGEQWSTDGVLAIRDDRFTAADLPDRTADIGAVVQEMANATERAVRSVGERGFAYLTIESGRIPFQDHVLALIEDAFPGCVWHASDGKSVARASIDGKTVAAFMPLTDDKGRGRYAPCPRCDGEDDPKHCATCRGTGRWAPEDDASATTPTAASKPAPAPQPPTRAERRRSVDAALAADARSWPEFASARRAVVMAACEQERHVLYVASDIYHICHYLREWEDGRGERPSAQTIAEFEHWKALPEGSVALYERVRRMR